jgi:hypothetical protein
MDVFEIPYTNSSRFPGLLETFASGRGIRNLSLLSKQYGMGRWRKRKGVALVRLKDGSECLAELHWYEASGIGRKEMKVKWLLE